MTRDDLIYTLAYIKRAMSRYPLRYIHNKDKYPLFLYLHERWNVYNHREPSSVEYTLTLDIEGRLYLDTDIDDEVLFEANKKFLSMRNIEISDKSKENIDYIVDKYIRIDYDTLIQRMCAPTGNYISPEMAEYLPLPYHIDWRIIKSKRDN